jgi:hypothetical protein
MSANCPLAPKGIWRKFFYPKQHISTTQPTGQRRPSSQTALGTSAAPIWPVITFGGWVTGSSSNEREKNIVAMGGRSLPDNHDINSTFDDRMLIPERDAARRLSLSVRSLFTLRTDGEIHFIKIGGRVLYDPVDLVSFIAAHRQIAERVGGQS